MDDPLDEGDTVINTNTGEEETVTYSDEYVTLTETDNGDENIYLTDELKDV